MKSMLAAFAMAALIASTGCDKGTPGGNVKDKEKDKGSAIKNPMSQDKGTFSLGVSSVTLKQGETKETTISIKRGADFGEDVAVKFMEVPEGVSFDPATPTIKKGDKDVMVKVKAADTAATNTFTVKVMGKPATGSEASHDLKLTVEKK